jgi:hypothetical protein
VIARPFNRTGQAGPRSAESAFAEQIARIERGSETGTRVGGRRQCAFSDVRDVARARSRAARGRVAGGDLQRVLGPAPLDALGARSPARALGAAVEIDRALREPRERAAMWATPAGYRGWAGRRVARLMAFDACSTPRVAA